MVALPAVLMLVNSSNADGVVIDGGVASRAVVEELQDAGPMLLLMVALPPLTTMPAPLNWSG